VSAARALSVSQLSPSGPAYDKVSWARTWFDQRSESEKLQLSLRAKAPDALHAASRGKDARWLT
jgi:hypothetical protein